MRIRKHARVSPPSPPPPPPPPSIPPEEVPSTAVCELNRSPWDVLAFHEYQMEINDDHTHNGVDRESYCSHDSFDSLKAKFWEDVAKKSKNEEIEVEDDEDDTMLLVHVVKDKLKKKLKLKKEKEMNYIRCGKTDGKGWTCKNQAKEGCPLCEHHLTQLESYKYKQSNCPRKPSEVECNKRAALKTTSRNKKRRKGRITSASPAEFYYYSGFGPSWGRRRGEGNEMKKEQLQVLDAYANDHEASSSSLVHATDDQDQDQDEADRYIDDDFSDDVVDDEDVVKDNGGEKRIRKRIKARSLKSLL